VWTCAHAHIDLLPSERERSFQAERIRPGLLLWRRSGMNPLVRGSALGGPGYRQTGGLNSNFPRACSTGPDAKKNNANPSGPYGRFWEEQLLGGFKGHHVYFTLAGR